ncbi:hypothetical protein ACFWOX_15625 [Streptomyces sp. NPDC058467]
MRGGGLFFPLRGALGREGTGVVEAVGPQVTGVGPAAMSYCPSPHPRRW